MFDCPQCTKTFEDKTTRALHLERRHGITKLGRMQAIRYTVVAIVVLAALAGVAAVVQNYEAPHRGGWNLEHEPMLGSPNATVQLVMFEDPNCPFCKRFHDTTFDQLKMEYVDTGRVSMHFKQFNGNNPWTLEGNIAAECAFRDSNEAFWEFIDRFYDQQSQISRANVGSVTTAWAAEIGIDVPAYQTCFDEKQTRAEVFRDYTDGSSLGARGTPTFFVRGPDGAELISGAQSYSVFQAAIEKALRATGG